MYKYITTHLEELVREHIRPGDYAPPGTDFDLFYEAYYSMDTDEIDELLEEWEADQ